MKKIEQNCINKRSGRRCQNFNKAEEAFQEAQRKWIENENDQKSWGDMWIYVRNCVFNIVNKKLEGLLEKEKIEERALDITCNIMQGIRKKRKNGKVYKIDKLSSYCYLPCLAIYSEKLQFEDSILGEDAFMVKDEKGNEIMMEDEDSVMDGGVYILRR